MSIKFTDAEIIAMTVMLARVIEGEDKKKDITEQRKALDEAYEEAEKRRLSAFRAFAVFGFDMSIDKPWDPVREAMGEAWNAGFRMARPNSSKSAYEDEQDEEGDDSGAAEEQSEAQTGESIVEGEEEAPAKQDMPTVREVVLGQLAAAGDKGVKAGDIRKFIEQTYNQAMHEKTVGMTLYRLSKDGLSRREGRIWFSATPRAETENPGVDAPGSEENMSS